ncbi:MAG: AEC family transporter [Chloroflexi bacterium]|nr:MAG: AEC family transporter [Chloroflexota bacterium]
MFLELAQIFINVITPVFAPVAVGYLAGPRLGLDGRTLSRLPYYILIPAFVFNVISVAEVPTALATQMILYILVVQLAISGLAFGVGKALRRPAKMVAAFVMVAAFPNVGNFGLPIITFRLGDEAVLVATVYFLAMMTIGFIVCVAAANWDHGGGTGAALAVFKTPALLALVPSLLVNWLNIEPPLFLMRATGLLAGAMVPSMLLSMGIHLAYIKSIKFSSNVMVASGIRLLAGPLLALLVAVPFGMTGIERGAGIFQAAMPAATLTAIIGMEYNLLPDFLTTTVLFSTLASVVTLTLVLALV